MKKVIEAAALSLGLIMTMSSVSFAGSWKQDSTGWWYQNDDGSWPVSGWQWIDGNQDGTAECYYFDNGGYCLFHTTTPDGYQVDENGACIVNGVVQTKSVPASSNSTETLIAQRKAEIAASQASSPITAAHSLEDYYKYVPAEGQAQAEQICREIADNILGDPNITTDEKRVEAAAETVAAYCAQDTYGSDSNKWYRSPYGVFVAGVYTCAGSTRALGRVLDYMGYKWNHRNPNQYTHQWCELYLNGQPAYADGMSGLAGYGTESADGDMNFFNDDLNNGNTIVWIF